jgi:hypothetical protein
MARKLYQFERLYSVGLAENVSKLSKIYLTSVIARDVAPHKFCPVKFSKIDNEERKSENSHTTRSKEGCSAVFC